MARPGRNATPEEILQPARTFFVTTKTAMGKMLLQSERNAELLVDVFRTLIVERQFEIHDFVIMPDHVHALVTLNGGMTIKKAMQLVKGRFSYRMSHENGYDGEVWQRGFSEVQVLGRAKFEAYRRYIAENPVKAGLAKSADEYLFCYRSLAKRKSAERATGAKAR